MVDSPSVRGAMTLATKQNYSYIAWQKAVLLPGQVRVPRGTNYFPRQN